MRKLVLIVMLLSMPIAAVVVSLGGPPPPPPPPWALAIQGLGPISIDVAAPGIEATGYDDFTVYVDPDYYTGAAVSAEVTVQPWSGAGMGCNVNPASIGTGDTSVRLTASITVPLSVPPDSYGGEITVTVIGAEL